MDVAARDGKFGVQWTIVGLGGASSLPAGVDLGSHAACPGRMRRCAATVRIRQPDCPCSRECLHFRHVLPMVGHGEEALSDRC